MIKKAFVFGGCAMCGYGAKQTLTLAWPTVDFGSLPVEGGVEASSAAQLAVAEDPEGLRRQIEERYKKYLGPYPAAGTFNIDDVIDPRETRPRIIQALELALNRRSAPAKPVMRHGMMP